MSNVFLPLALAACLSVPSLAAAPAFAAADQPAASEQIDAQRKLSEPDIAAFLAASRSVEPIAARLQEDKRGDPDAATLSQLDKAAKAAGLKSYADYDEIAANVDFVLQGFDSEKKALVGAKALIQAEIARAKADKNLSKRERADALSELNEALQNAEDVQYPENIALVAKHYDELTAAVGR